MPLPVMNDVEIGEAVKLLDADLHLALSRNDVSRHVMAVLAKAIISSLPYHRMGRNYSQTKGVRLPQRFFF